jgi:uncharacterized membrane protein YfcA
VIKNYLGFKNAFFFAFLSFYTTWLIPIAIIGIGVSIYSALNTEQQILNLAYVFFLLVWLAIVFERWKRKANEIALKWGILAIKNVENEEP